MHTRVFISIALLGAVALGCGILTGPDAPGSLAIERFLATPDRVDSGGKVTLLWSVDGAETVAIDNGIGEVDPRGSLQVTPSSNTTYTLTAEGGSSSATATVLVAVGKPSASPEPTPRPSPLPSPTPRPSPSPSASPSPSPSPSASPSALPPENKDCGTAAAPPDTCGLTIETPVALPRAECVQVTRVVAVPACPVTAGMTRTITFDINAKTSAPLTWRRSAGGGDAVSPASGTVAAQGVTSVTTNAVVFDSGLSFEVVNSAGSVVLRFTMRHR